jgi:hypothetical protein
MLNPRRILYLALRFVALFGLLVLPWPGFQASFAAGYQAGARAILGVILPNREVAVEPYHEPKHLSVDSRICLSDPRDRQTDGSLPVRVLTLDSRSLGWMPMAMFIALWGSTPLSWSERWKMLAAGSGGILLFVAATVLAHVCPAIFPEPGWRHFLAIVANHLLVENLWLSFVGPALIWLAGIVWLWPALTRVQTPTLPR